MILPRELKYQFVGDAHSLFNLKRRGQRGTPPALMRLCRSTAPPAPRAAPRQRGAASGHLARRSRRRSSAEASPLRGPASARCWPPRVPRSRLHPVAPSPPTPPPSPPMQRRYLRPPGPVDVSASQPHRLPCRMPRLLPRGRNEATPPRRVPELGLRLI